MWLPLSFLVPSSKQVATVANVVKIYHSLNFTWLPEPFFSSKINKKSQIIRLPLFKKNFWHASIRELSLLLVWTLLLRAKTWWSWLLLLSRCFLFPNIHVAPRINSQGSQGYHYYQNLLSFAKFRKPCLPLPSFTSVQRSSSCCCRCY